MAIKYHSIVANGPLDNSKYVIVHRHIKRPKITPIFCWIDLIIEWLLDIKFSRPIRFERVFSATIICNYLILQPVD